ncbi:MAG: hypothetical protein WCH11_01045 [Bdellovibrio sp.]
MRACIVKFGINRNSGWIQNLKAFRAFFRPRSLAGVLLTAWVPTKVEASSRCVNWSNSAPTEVLGNQGKRFFEIFEQERPKALGEDSLWMTSGVKSDLIGRAKQDPELFPLLKALHEVDRFLKVVPSGLLSTLKQGFSDPEIETSLEVNLFRPSREVPSDFVEKAIRHLDLNRDLIEKVYSSLSKRFFQEEMSDEALVVLSHVLGEKYLAPVGELNLLSGPVPSDWSVEANLEKRLTLLQSFFRVRKQTGQLPHFNEYLSRNPRLMMRAFVLVLRIALPKSSGVLHSNKSLSWEQSLMEFHLDLAAQKRVLKELTSSPEASFEKKVQILLSYFDESTQKYLRQEKVLKVFAAPTKVIASLEKWKTLGAAIMTEVVDDFARALIAHAQGAVRDMANSNLQVKINLGDLQMELNLETDIDHPADFPLVLDILRFINMRKDQSNPNGTIRFREAAEKRLFALGRQLNAVLAKSQREELQAQRLALGTVPSITSYQLRTRKGPRHVSIRLRDAPVQPLSVEPAVPSALASSLREAVLREHLENLDPNLVYQFQMGESLERETPSEKRWQRMNIGSEVAKILQSHGESVDSWIRAFVKGPAARVGESGLIKIASARSPSIWEIKVRGSEFRIILRHAKESNLWQWLAIVHHDDVQSYVKRHKL